MKLIVIKLKFISEFFIYRLLRWFANCAPVTSDTFSCRWIKKDIWRSGSINYIYGVQTRLKNIADFLFLSSITFFLEKVFSFFPMTYSRRYLILIYWNQLYSYFLHQIWIILVFNLKQNCWLEGGCQGKVQWETELLDGRRVPREGTLGNMYAKKL